MSSSSYTSTILVPSPEAARSMPSLEKAILSRHPPTRNSSGVHRRITRLHYAVDATYWSNPGDETILVNVKNWGVPDEEFAYGTTMPDQDGSTPYVIVKRTGYTPYRVLDGLFITAVRRDVYDQAREEYESASREQAAYAAARNDRRLPLVQRLVKRAIETTGLGWYADVYLDDADMTIGVTGPVSTGFQTAFRQDGITVLFRSIEGDSHNALEDGRRLQALAVDAVKALREREAELREAEPAYTAAVI